MKFLGSLFFAAAIAPIAADTGKVEPVSAINLAAADGKYGTLLSAVTNTPGVLSTISANFPVSIFGPTDAAFAAIADTVAGLDENALARILAGHVVTGVFTAQNVIDAGCVELATLAGNQIRVWYTNGNVMVNDATVIQADIIGDEGVIHGIDKVILPGTFRPCPAAVQPAPAASPVAAHPVAAPSMSKSGTGMSSKEKGGSKRMSSKSSKKMSKSGKGGSTKGMSSAAKGGPYSGKGGSSAKGSTGKGSVRSGANSGKGAGSRSGKGGSMTTASSKSGGKGDSGKGGSMTTASSKSGGKGDSGKGGSMSIASSKSGGKGDSGKGGSMTTASSKSGGKGDSGKGGAMTTGSSKSGRR
ncbi:MAG: hypothetical protein SGBAC_009066, partial [Bacillariaceae sp.]